MPKKAMEQLTESMYYVLLALRSGEKCGTEIAAYVQALTGGRVVLGPATLYTILGKFQQEGWTQETAVDGRRRTYAVTGAGEQAFQTELARLRTCVADAERGRFYEAGLSPAAVPGV